MATMTVNELAEKLGTTGRVTRKFLRSVTPVEDQPGKGGRWQIEKRDVRSLTKKFTDFQNEHMRSVEVPNDDEPESNEE